MEEFARTSNKLIARTLADNLESTQPMSARDLAIRCGFDKERLKYFDLFHGDEFDTNIIALLPEFIRRNLVSSCDSRAPAHYIKTMLINSDVYVLGKDYFILDVNNVADKEGIDSMMYIVSGNEIPLDLSLPRGSPAIYYGVTGFCLKKLLMMARTPMGDRIRNLFIDIDRMFEIHVNLTFIIEQRLALHREAKLAIEAKEAIDARKSAENQLVIREAKLTIEFQEASVREEKLRNKLADCEDKLKDKPVIFKGREHFEYDKVIYILADKTMMRASDFKYGRTTRDEKTARLSDYNVGRTNETRASFKYLRLCNNAKLIENCIHARLDSFAAIDEAHEVVKVPFVALRDIIDKYIDADNFAIGTLETLMARQKTTPNVINTHIPDVVSFDEDACIIENMPITIESATTSTADVIQPVAPAPVNNITINNTIVTGSLVCPYCRHSFTTSKRFENHNKSVCVKSHQKRS